MFESLMNAEVCLDELPPVGFGSRETTAAMDRHMSAIEKDRGPQEDDRGSHSGAMKPCAMQAQLK